MMWQLIKQTVLIPLWVLALIPQANASNICEAAFKSKDAQLLKLNPSKRLGRSTKKVDLEHDLLLDDSTGALKRLLHRKSNFKVQMTESRLSRISIEGVPYTAYYSKWTPVGRKPLRTIVLQHGFSRSSRYFHDMVLMLTSLGFEVVAQDAVNIGKTLALTAQDFPDSQGIVPAPSPLNDALTLRNIILNERLKNVVLLGHSRGHAVTSLVAAMDDVAPFIDAHLAVNPYTRWLVDDYYENHFVTRAAMQTQALLPPSLTWWTDAPRSFLNSMGSVEMEKLAAKSLKDRDAHETFPENDVKIETKAAVEIGAGLRGKNSGAPGYSALPLYGLETATLSNSTNDFGLERVGIDLIEDRILHRTFVLYGGADTLVKPDQLKGLINVPGVRARNFSDGDHYLPSHNPGGAVRYLIESLRALAN